MNANQEILTLETEIGRSIPDARNHVVTAVVIVAVRAGHLPFANRVVRGQVDLTADLLMALPAEVGVRSAQQSRSLVTVDEVA